MREGGVLFEPLGGRAALAPVLATDRRLGNLVRPGALVLVGAFFSLNFLFRIEASVIDLAPLVRARRPFILILRFIALNFVDFVQEL